MVKIKIVFFHIICFVVLTIVTQIGGILWLLSVGIAFKAKQKKRYIFPITYLLFNLLIVPPLASQFGRKQLPVFNANIKPRNIVYPLLFRNYVTKELYSVLKHSAEELSKKEIQITYLDANFPFINGFPLLPHRSHNDGKKIDISFMYLNAKGKPTIKKPATSGYGAYVKPGNATTNSCLKKGYWQYDFPKYLTLGTNNTLQFDNINTRRIVATFLKHPKTEKVFIEPYLKQKLNLNHNKIRFHGCKAVRHDDHIHLQIK
jgi:hypothetical protein